MAKKQRLASRSLERTTKANNNKFPASSLFAIIDSLLFCGFLHLFLSLSFCLHAKILDFVFVCGLEIKNLCLVVIEVHLSKGKYRYDECLVGYFI